MDNFIYFDKKNRMIRLMILMIVISSCNLKNRNDINAVMKVEKNKTVMLNKNQMALANITTDTVREGNISEEISLSGTVVINPEKAEKITSRINRRIDKLYFKSEGDRIKKGDLIYEIYSDEMFASIKEMLSIVEMQKNNSNKNNEYEDILKATENKLLLWGLTKEQIEKIKKDGKANPKIGIYSSSNGYIYRLNVKEGDYVREGDEIMTVSDYKSLWVEAKAYGKDINYTEEGKNVNIRIDAFQERIIKSKIAFISPATEKNRKYNLVRIDLDNSDGDYRPGMMTTVYVKTKEKKCITIPLNGLIQERKETKVWIQNKDGYFEERMVQTGIITSDKAEIISGLNIGEVVVITGAYLLNSEAIFK